ncbi:MAG: hypothetical protein MJ252_12625 [archaeon]|nr:hypothetical protein [archaeon]
MSDEPMSYFFKQLIVEINGHKIPIQLSTLEAVYNFIVDSGATPGFVIQVKGKEIRTDNDFSELLLGTENKYEAQLIYRKDKKKVNKYDREIKSIIEKRFNFLYEDFKLLLENVTTKILPEMEKLKALENIEVNKNKPRYQNFFESEVKDSIPPPIEGNIFTPGNEFEAYEKPKKESEEPIEDIETPTKYKFESNIENPIIIPNNTSIIKKEYTFKNTSNRDINQNIIFKPSNEFSLGAFNQPKITKPFKKNEKRKLNFTFKFREDKGSNFIYKGAFFDEKDSDQISDNFEFNFMIESMYKMGQCTPFGDEFYGGEIEYNNPAPVANSMDNFKIKENVSYESFNKTNKSEGKIKEEKNLTDKKKIKEYKIIKDHEKKPSEDKKIKEDNKIKEHEKKPSEDKKIKEDEKKSSEGKKVKEDNIKGTPKKRIMTANSNKKENPKLNSNRKEPIRKSYDRLESNKIGVNISTEDITKVKGHLRGKKFNMTKVTDRQIMSALKVTNDISKAADLIIRTNK